MRVVTTSPWAKQGAEAWVPPGKQGDGVGALGPWGDRRSSAHQGTGAVARGGSLGALTCSSHRELSRARLLAGSSSPGS